MSVRMYWLSTMSVDFMASSLGVEQGTLKEIAEASKVYGVTLTPKGDEVAISLK